MSKKLQSKFERLPDGNIVTYIKTKSKECADNNRVLVTFAKDGAISFIRMNKPMQSVLLYPDQVKEFFELVKVSSIYQQESKVKSNE